MRRITLARVGVLAVLMMLVVFGTVSAALAAPSISQSPNYSGQTWAVGSQQTVTWTSSELDPGATLWLTMQDSGGAQINVLATGLPQNGSFTFTVPDDIGTGPDYVCYLSTDDQTVYSDAVSGPDLWLLTLGPAVVSTPASSPWSLALAAFAALGLFVAVPALRSRIAGSKV